MNRKIGLCDPRHIEAYLSEQLSGENEEALLQHLDSCDTCRDLLERTAAQRETWDSIHNQLNDDDYDPTSLSSDTNSHGETTNVSLHIGQVLDQLAPTDDPQMLGRLGGYEISGVVGAGGMGIVLKGYDRALDRVVAIKVLAPHLARSAAARQRFAREAKAAAAVLHPNIIAIHCVSNVADLPHLVMPYVRGNSLQQRLDQQGPLAVKEVLRVGCQIAAGLAAAHSQGLVHRDIKPANVLLEDGVERVTITDFGLARAADEANLTLSGVIAGTPQYMSPEQATGEAIDARSDLFSLGSVMYAMCTGRVPFRAETTYGILRRITDDKARSIREINPDTPDWLCRLIDLLHKKRPSERLQSAAEAESLMQRCLAHLEQPRQNSLPGCLIPRSRVGFRLAFLFGLLSLIAVVGQVVKSQVGRDAARAPLTVHAENAAHFESTSADSLSENVNSTNDWNDGVTEMLQEVVRTIEQLERDVTEIP
jgi:serine/threonine protein kinase